MAIGDPAWCMGGAVFHVERVLFDLDVAHRNSMEAGEADLAAALDVERTRMRQLAERVKKARARLVGGQRKGSEE